MYRKVYEPRFWNSPVKTTSGLKFRRTIRVYRARFSKFIFRLAICDCFVYVNLKQGSGVETLLIVDQFGVTYRIAERRDAVIGSVIYITPSQNLSSSDDIAE